MENRVRSLTQSLIDFIMKISNKILPKKLVEIEEKICRSCSIHFFWCVYYSC